MGSLGLFTHIFCSTASHCAVRVVTVEPLTDAQIRSSFINCSKGEAKRMNVPRNLDAIAWDGLQFFSWIDDKNPQKACLIIPDQDGNTAGIVLTRAKTQGKRAQMCSFCMTLHPGSGISLFSAAKVGEAGRRGNTLGTYICSNLRCHDYVTGKKKPEGIRQMDETLSTEQRLERMQENARSFVKRLVDAS